MGGSDTTSRAGRWSTAAALTSLIAGCGLQAGDGERDADHPERVVPGEEGRSAEPASPGEGTAVEPRGLEARPRAPGAPTPKEPIRTAAPEAGQILGPLHRIYLRDCDEDCVDRLLAVQTEQLAFLAVEGPAQHPRCAVLDHRALERLVDGLEVSHLYTLRTALQGADGIRLLGQLPAQIEALSLCTDDAGVRQLARTPALASLERLELSVPMSPLTGTAVEALLTSPHLQGLEQLALRGGDSEAEATLGPEAWRALLQHLDLPGLTHLDLSWTLPTEEQVVELLQRPWIDRLEILDLEQTHLTPRIRAILTERGPWPGLEQLCISNHVVPASGADVEAVAARFGDRFAHSGERCEVPLRPAGVELVTLEP